jgi:peptidylprolyl isomerase
VQPLHGQKVTVHCTGYGKNGDLAVPFWSTRDEGQTPFTFTIGQKQVIRAWDEGVATMLLGERARIRARPDYAYGAGGFPAWGIQPDSVLVFDIETLSYG